MMKSIATTGLGLIAALMLIGLAASPSLALPDGSLTLSGSSFPLRLNFESAATTGALETTAGGLLNGRGGKISLSVTQLTSLGTARLTFEDVEDGTKKCKSTGDTAGTILVEGTGHLVYTSLSPNLQLGILYEPIAFEIECEGTFVEVKGDALASLNGIGTETTELVSASGKLSGIKGSQEIKEYYNDNGTKVKTQLLSNPGNGFKESDLVVEGEPVLKAAGSNMFVITGR